MSGVSGLSEKQLIQELIVLLEELEGGDDDTANDFENQAQSYGGGNGGQQQHNVDTSGQKSGGGQTGSGNTPQTTSATQSPATSTSTSTTSTSQTTGTVAGANDSDAATAIADNLEQTFGLNKTQIAGVLGNLEQESNLTPNVNQNGSTGAPSSNDADDNENGWGLAQWGGTRKTGEIQYAQEHGEDPGSMAANLGFMDQELQGSYSNTISAMKSTNSTSDAALVWDEDYEQATDPEMSNRDQYANQFLQEGF